jgi:vacuolar-type H+-ATPase subunit H
MAGLKLIQEIKKAEDKAREMIKRAETRAAIAIEEAKGSAVDEIDQQRNASIRMLVHQTCNPLTKPLPVC